MTPLIFAGIISLSLLSGGSSLKQIFPQPILRNPSFEDHCATENTSFFYSADPAKHFENGLNNISSSNAVSLMEWNVSGQGLEVVYGSASDGACSLSPFWDGEAGGVNQTFSTAPNASYIVRLDMMVFDEVCGDSVRGVISIELPAGRQNATKLPGGSGGGTWFSLMYLVQGSSYQTELSITGIEGSCGIAVDNVRVELMREASSNVLLNGGFELSRGVPADPGSAGYQLQTGSRALSSWVVTGNGVTCFGPSVFPATEGQRLIWLATKNSFTQEAGGLIQVLSTIANTTHHISFDATCQCDSNSKSTSSYCQLEIVIGGRLDSLNFTLPARNHTAENPGWTQQVVEFTAKVNQTNVTFQDSTSSHRIFGVAYNKCAPYLDNVVVTIPAQQALVKLKAALGSPGTLLNWGNAYSHPCLIPLFTNASWTGITCAGADVIGVDLYGLGLSQEIPMELFPLYPTLRYVNLSNNALNGSIPLFLATMPNLISLDLSNNKLQGVIPAELGNLSLQVLKLDRNELGGEIPESLAMPSLKVLSLQGNNLSGAVPQQISMQRANGTILTFSPGNGNLCSDETVDSLNRCTGHFSSVARVLVILVVILATAGAGGIAIGVIGSWCFRKYKTAHAQEKIDLNLDTCQAFSLKEATQGFSEVLGRGGYERVCKAHLKDGRMAAVKRLNHVSRQGQQEFISEFELLSRLHHANLVSLLGYCIQDGEYILVYEFMPRGSLSASLERLKAHGKEELLREMLLQTPIFCS